MPFLDAFEVRRLEHNSLALQYCYIDGRTLTCGNRYQIRSPSNLTWPLRPPKHLLPAMISIAWETSI
jgi:hypothetical protein